MIRLLCLLMMAKVLYSADDQVCASCHQQQTAHFHETAMARALEPAAASDVLRTHPDLRFAEGAYQSRIVREGNRSILTVTDGSAAVSVLLLWAFGRGEAGQTYVFERDGAFYESRVSFFNAIQKLDLTMGAQGSKPSSVEEAAGRRMEASDARDCFGCHSNGGVVQGKLQMATLSPGVACGSCHQGSSQHVSALRSRDVAAAKMPKLARLDAEEMSEACGRCHRTWAQIAANGPRGVNNVRFQPYRLTNSKCYDPADARISCAACHDPHRPVKLQAASYDARCGACHGATASAKMCPVGKKDCANCHMPKIELPGAHARFTDHQIRIVRAGEAYPN